MTVGDREGVDVSSFNGEPGQWRGEAGDIGFAAVKLTELGADGSRYVNPDAAADWAWLKANGKKRIAYLFAHPATDPADTASFFTGELRKLGLDEGDMAAVDLEVTDGRTPAEVAAWAATVTGYLHHDLARLPLLYTFIAFAQAGNCAGLGHCPLWIADPSDAPGHPHVPAPWRDWAIHQWGQRGLDRDLTAWRSAEAMSRHLGRAGTGLVPLHVPKRRVRKAAKRIASGTKKAARAVHRTVRAEPVVTSAGIAGVLSAAAAFLAQHAGLHLTHTQVAAAVTALTGLAGLFSAARTRSASGSAAVPAVTGILGTIAAAAAAFGLHAPPAWLGTEIPVAALAVSLLLRGHVSPKGAAAAPGAKLPPLVQRIEADFSAVHDALDEVTGHAERAAAAVASVAPALPVAPAPGPLTVLP